MPEALATSKRKFYKYLDNLTAPPRPQVPVTATAQATTSTRNAPIASTAHPITIEPASKRLRGSTSSTSLSSLHARNISNPSVSRAASLRTSSTKASSSQQSPAAQKETPHFSPWSHETFLARLKTFAPVTAWHSKPDAVNEVEWAKRGWVCVDTNTVCCKGGCGKRVQIRLEPSARRRMRSGNWKLDQDGEEQGDDQGREIEHDEGDEEEEEQEDDDSFENALVERYKDLIVQGHGESCLWRRAGCKNDIYKLPIVRTAVWQSDVNDRYNSCLELADALKDVQTKTVIATPAAEKLLINLPSKLLSKAQDADASAHTSHEGSEVNVAFKAKALTITLCGWRGVTESHTALLSCDACFQRVGLWMYQPDYKRARPTATTNSATTKSAAEEDHHEEEAEEEEDSASLDLVEMHREHCPWRNGASQCATGDFAGLPAWRILWTVVARYADEQRRRSTDRSVVVSAAPAVAAEGDSATPAAAAEHGVNEDEEYRVLESPVFSREEVQRQDKERITKLRKLKRVLGFKKRVPATS